MSETKWTPGPWEWQELMPEDKDWGMCEITASDDNFVCTAVIGVDNARLISAAPDMAEALQASTKLIDSILIASGEAMIETFVQKLAAQIGTNRAALAKARGET